jgi:hypothetical protein
MTVSWAIAVPKATSRRCRNSATVSVSRATSATRAPFALGGQDGAADGRNLPDGDLTAGIIEKGLDIVERRCQRCFLREYHQAAASAFVTCSGCLGLAATFQGKGSSILLTG